jgi:hypothetical protein
MRYCLLFLNLIVLNSAVFAADVLQQSAGDAVALGAPVAGGTPNVRADYSYTFESDFDDRRLGALSVSRFNALARVPVPLVGNLRLQTGVSYRRLDFAADSALVPQQMQGIAALVGLEYLVAGQPAIGVRAAPGFYFIDSIDADSFDVPTIAYAAWRFTPSFIGIGGASYSSMRADSSVIPIAGFIWTISDDIKFNAILPVASLDFAVSDDVTFSLIGEYVGLRANTGDDLAAPEYRGANVSYSEFRAGVQLGVGLSDTASLQFSGGWAFRQEFEFDSPDESYRTGGAPFVGVSFKKSF